MLMKRKFILYTLLIIIILLVLLFLYVYREKVVKIITPFLIAIVIAYMVNPMVIRLEYKNVPRKTGVLLIYLGFVITLAAVSVFVIPEVINNTRELLDTLPVIITKYQNFLNGIISYIQTSKWSGDIKLIIFQEVQDLGLAAQNAITGRLKKSLSALVATAELFFDIALAMVIAYYFIVDAGFFKELMLSLPPKKWRNGIIMTFKEINLILSKFIQGQLLVALIIGALEMTGLSIVKVKYALVLGLVGGIANVIPYFGPVIGAVPAVAVALIESPVKALWTALVFVIAQQIDNTLISPKIIEGRLGMHPVVTILIVLIGGEFFGISGMLLAVPVTAIIKVLAKRAVEAIV